MAFFNLPPYSFRNQPFKGIYLAYHLLTTLFIRVPIWALLAIPSRPRKSWSIVRTVLVKIIRHLTLNISPQIGPAVNLPNSTKLVTTKGELGLWIEPIPFHLVQGDVRTLAKTADVFPARIPGYWYHKKGLNVSMGARARKDEKVLLQLHGGAYIRLSAHPNDPTAHITKGFVEHKFERAFSVEYRLSSSKPFPVAHPFPTALLDALSGYAYLIQLGFSPSDITVSGDSAGGNLALALVRYLVEQRGQVAGLPEPPNALVLLSPWTDLYDMEAPNPDSSLYAYRDTDYIALTIEPGYANQSFVGPHGLGAALFNRYISPAGLHPVIQSTISFKGFPRTFIVAGGAEILHDQIVRLKDRMTADLGEDNVRFYRAPDAIHDYIVFAWHEPERSDTLRAIAEWL